MMSTKKRLQNLEAHTDTFIETKNASLSTMAVTIKALHVNSKQMTLAVFRQLPRMDAYNADGSLVTLEHWGLVRYDIKDQGVLWLVCSKDGVLYRGNASNPFNLPRLQGIYEGWTMDLVEYTEWEQVELAYQSSYQFPRPEQPRSIRGAKTGNLAWYQQGQIESWKKLEIAQNAEASYQQLLKLPQLFIAV